MATVQPIGNDFRFANVDADWRSLQTNLVEGEWYDKLQKELQRSPAGGVIEGIDSTLLELYGHARARK